MSAKERITFVIEQRSKHLPYPPDKRADGENFGFQILKGASAEEIGKISEVQNCAALKDALIAINAPRTRFFTVGCEKSLNRARGAFVKKGYLEFSYNHTDGLKDATGYFILFFHFHRLNAEYVTQNHVQYVWDLQPAHFKEIDAPGFTCCVWIITDPFESRTGCEEAWDGAVATLATFLTAVKPLDLPPLYGATTQDQSAPSTRQASS